MKKIKKVYCITMCTVAMLFALGVCHFAACHSRHLLQHICDSGATWAALQYPMADIRCITFGSPRVGNKAFKRAFHTLVGTSLRLVHGGDPIPVLPPAFV